MTKGIKFLSV